MVNLFFRVLNASRNATGTGSPTTHSVRARSRFLANGKAQDSCSIRNRKHHKKGTERPFMNRRELLKRSAAS
jgi:hypothetical protein